MKKINQQQFDVIIVGGSYSGLAAAMALGRALKQVLVIDSGKPCNRQTPFSHNFLTQDGTAPGEIAALGKQQVQAYQTVTFFDGLAAKGRKAANGFEIQVSSGEIFYADKLIFSTGILDLMQDIPGLSDCWGISVIHCPYCHGYEVRNAKTGILGNGEDAYELVKLISNWTKDLTVFTNGSSIMSADQLAQLERHDIKIVEKEVEKMEHNNGHLQQIFFKDGTSMPLIAMYARSGFEQHCRIPEILGCELTEEGYISVDAFQETSVSGVFACGDNATRMRTVANAVSMGTMAGITASRKMIMEEF